MIPIKLLRAPAVLGSNYSICSAAGDYPSSCLLGQLKFMAPDHVRIHARIQGVTLRYTESDSYALNCNKGTWVMKKLMILAALQS